MPPRTAFQRDMPQNKRVAFQINHALALAAVDPFAGCERTTGNATVCHMKRAAVRQAALAAERTAERIARIERKEEAMVYVRTAVRNGSAPSLVYVKIPKTGSSTSAGVTRRIGAHWGLHGVSNGSEAGCAYAEALARTVRRAPQTAPLVYANHCRPPYDSTGRVQTGAVDRLIARLNRSRTFVWTVLRDPAARCMSAFYHFRVLNKGVSATSHHKVTYAKQSCINNQWRWMRSPLGRPKCAPLPAWDVRARNESWERRSVRCALDRFDFVGVVEHFDESMVQLALAARTTLSSVLYAPAKTRAYLYAHAKYMDGGAAPPKVTPRHKALINASALRKTAAWLAALNRSDAGRWPSFNGSSWQAKGRADLVGGEPPAVRAYLRGREFERQNHLDFRLWRTARARARRANATARPPYASMLSAYLAMQRAVLEGCPADWAIAATSNHARCVSYLVRASSGAPSSCGQAFEREAGEDCYWNDNGCSISCIDAMFGN